MATLLKSDDTEQEVKPASGKIFSLTELQKYVGGYIEQIPLPDGRALIMNEDGKRDNLPFNVKATAWGRIAGIAGYDYIVGNVVICSMKELQ